MCPKNEIDFDFKGKASIYNLQMQLLQNHLDYLLEKSPYYRVLFAEIGLKNSKDIANIQDLSKIPLTDKDHLASQNDSFLCTPIGDIIDFVTTSGTLGDPITFYLTRKDIDRLAYNEAKSFRTTGASESDIFQLTTTLDKRFMAGLAYYEGVKMLGAGMIRVGPGVPYLQWDSIKRFNPTYLIVIPSFIPKMLEYAVSSGIDYKNSSLKGIICIGEPIRNENFEANALGKRIYDLWPGIQLFSTYASTEMGAAFTECSHGMGGHLNPELLLLEVIDQYGAPVSSGESGEVVVSTFGVEGMPLLRYRTGDVCNVYYEKCYCGRYSPRLGPVIGRKKQMIKFKGTTLFPQAVFDVLDHIDDLKIYQVALSSDEFLGDNIRVILPQEMESDDFHKKLISMFKSKIRVTPEIVYWASDQLEASLNDPKGRKPLKLLDYRGV